LFRSFSRLWGSVGTSIQQKWSDISRGEALLDARRRELARGGRTPGQKYLGGAAIGPAHVRVADIGREEFEEARAGTIAGDSDQRRELGRRDRDELVHG
jgi:hypothetical protein